jgi:hypothetical protein
VGPLRTRQHKEVIKQDEEVIEQSFQENVPLLRHVCGVVVDNDCGDKLGRYDGAPSVDHNPAEGIDKTARIALHLFSKTLDSVS